MNSDFPRILTLLRKEKGISQKLAASELGISQALLSHYEKGIRECGLDFVVRTSEFYNVSCDYLLGRSPERSGATLSFDDIPEIDATARENMMKGSLLPILNKKLISNTLSIVFDLLQKMNNNALTTEISAYIMICVYESFRTIYDINPKNESTLFTLPENTYSNLATAKSLEVKAKIRALIDNNDNLRDAKIDRNILLITSDMLQENYPALSSSLLNLIKTGENNIASK